MRINRVMLADSYKYSQPKQYPKDATFMSSYLESRGGDYNKVVFFGLQYLWLNYFAKPITAEEVEEAANYAAMHGEPFEYDGWMKVVNEHNGFLPININAVEEGTVVPTHQVLMTIDSTDPELFWIVSFLETLLMKIWYPITVATKSHYVKLMLQNIMDCYSDNNDVSFMYHNFGDRGSTSVEAAAIGGVAHLTSFLGTDNFHCLKLANDFYDEKCAGFSVPATEHSTVTSWTKAGELDMISNHLEVHKSSALIACVMDSYDVYKATSAVTSGEFKEKIESDDYPIFVLRPDSGEPLEVITKMLEILMNNNVKHTINSKNLIVFNKYRILYGDGITPEVIESILLAAVRLGFAPDNFAFGSGGDLMQNITRDTQKFAIKCSVIGKSDGTFVNVFKDPITDPGKKSKAGRLDLVEIYGTPTTVPYGSGGDSLLKPVIQNGVLKCRTTLEKVRSNLS